MIDAHAHLTDPELLADLPTITHFVAPAPRFREAALDKAKPRPAMQAKTMRIRRTWPNAFTWQLRIFSGIWLRSEWL